MATVEAEIPATEQPPATEESKPVTEEAKPVEKPVKERKAKVPKEKKPKQPKTASHPPYFQMIKEALLALNDKSGSSPYAIGKYMEGKHKAVLPANFRKTLALQLKNSVAKGKLIKIKASYKLSAEAGKKEKGTAKAPKAKTEKKMKQDSKPKKSEAAKKPAKKVGAKKTKAPAKPKQPKSIRSPAAKRAKKATAQV